MSLKFNPLLIIPFISFINACSTYNSLLDNKLELHLCPNNTAQRLKIEYSSKPIENEYIVTFNGYYKDTARLNFIGASLNCSGILKWKVLSRDNPAKKYPSDFDVLVIEDGVKFGVGALMRHPSIKRVTAQRLVQRTLKFIDDELPRTRKQQFWGEDGHFVQRQLLRAIPRQITSVLQADALWNMGITGKAHYKYAVL